MKKLVVTGPATPQQVETAYKTATQPFAKERLLAIRLAQKGDFTLAQIAKIVGRARSTIAEWIKTYRAGRIEALLARHYEGGKPRWSDQDLNELLEGLKTGRWKTTFQILKWAETRGIKVLQGSVYYWVKKLKGSWKVPRKSHIKKDPQDEEEFKENLTQKLQQLEIPPDRPVRVWVEDEHRYGLISIVRRCWMLRGERVKVPYQTKYEWGYVYAAIEAVNSKAEFLYTPTVNLEWTEAFLQQLVRTDPEAIHILIWDQAGFHHKEEKANLPESVRMLPLPPYCRELNPVEPLWDQVKREEGNQAWESLEKIEEAITQVLEPFWQQVEKVRSLLGVSWFTTAVASFLSHRISPNSS